MKTSQPNTTAVVSKSPLASEVTVYTGGPAIVREERLLALAEGKSAISLDGLPETYVPGSLTIARVAGGALKLNAFSYRPANLNLETILEKALGKDITLKSPTGEVSGTLRHVLHNQLVLEKDGQVTVVVNNGALQLAAESLAGISTLASVCLETEGAAGEYRVGVMYASEGLSWNPRFEAFYDAATEKLSRLACWVDLTNNTGAPLDDTRFQLIAGYNAGYGGGYGHRSRGAKTAALSMASAGGGGLEAASFSADAASVESVGEQKLYTLPTLLGVAHGETKTTALLLAEDVPVVAEYILNGGHYMPRAGRQSDDKVAVNVRLKLVNDEASKLGTALPPGVVSIFEPDSKGSLQRTDTSQVGSHVSVGEAFTLTLNTPARDVKASRRQVSVVDDPVPAKPQAPADTVGLTAAVPAPAPVAPEPEAPRYRNEARELTLFNYKDKAVSVQVQDYLPHNAEIIGSPVAARNLATAGNTVTFDVSVPAGGQVKIAYRVKSRIN